MKSPVLLHVFKSDALHFVSGSKNNFVLVKLLDPISRGLRKATSFFRISLNQVVVPDMPTAMTRQRVGARIWLSHPPRSVSEINVIMARRTPGTDHEPRKFTIRLLTSECR
jgi:hypothetical protein